MLQVKGLTVSAQGKIILKDFNIEIKAGEVHALMGQNGTGKSTLCKVLLRDPEYVIEAGSILWNGNDVTKMSTTEVAREKVFLLNQSPIAIEGVTNAEMLRTTLAEVTGKQVGIFEFSKKLELICQKLGLDKSFIHREINVGMSGGERKKNELLHMWMLEPKLLLLDEFDSGLDVDAIKLVAQSIQDYYEEFRPTILIITHHANVLDYFRLDEVHVMSDGKIIKNGDRSLALEINEKGFKKAFDISGQDENE
ncbi:MAG: Fe-S cluster assembly ATPase SufC [Bacilli bacterium]|nr:Fe-S cluster assembly ATPase SufC [Bacilli bacterium]